jgi:diguanylate cyclase (GGDEF)-like protein
MLSLISSEILSFLIVFTIYIDLQMAKPVKEPAGEQYFRHTTFVSMIAILIGIAMSVVSKQETPVVHQWILPSLGAVQLISIPLMVVLWTRMILMGMRLERFWTRILMALCWNLFTIFALMVCADLYFGTMFQYDHTTHQLQGGYGTVALVAIGLFSALIVLIPLIAKRRMVSVDRFITMLAFPFIYPISILIFVWQGNHQPFTISLCFTVFAISRLIHHRRFRYDMLTGLPTRRMFIRRLDRLLARARRCAVLVLDVDDFQGFNHRYGDENGDRLLHMMAHFLENTVKGCKPYRIGDNQFGLILKDCGEADALEFTQTIRKRMKQPWRVGGNDVMVRFHYAMVLAPEHIQTVNDAIHCLSFTIAEAKRTDATEVKVFDRDAIVCSEEKRAMRIMLKEKVRSGDLVIHYQPIFDLSTMKIVRAEALVRLYDRFQGLVYPKDFISIAEQDGMIDELLDKVMYAVCGFSRTLFGISRTLERVSVNFSVRNLMRTDIVEKVIETLNRNGLEPEKFEIDVTESTLIESYEDVRNTLSSFMEKGITCSLDDYGKGCSNISSIISLPFDIVKLDRDILLFAMSKTYFLEEIVKIFHKLGKKVVVEGVETVRQFEFCKQIGVDYAQGFFLGEPMPQDKFYQLVLDQQLA